MATVRDLISGSLRLIQAIATGETPTASELADGLLVLNDMLGNWSTESLLINNRVREVFPLTAGQAAYTMGTGGNFNSARPNEIEEVKLLQDSVETPVEIINLQQWSEIALKTNQTTMPTKVYPEMSYPLLTLNFWPVPSVANSAVIYSRKSLSAFASVNDTFDLPPGYAKAIRYNLAIELAPEYGKQASAEVIAGASDGLANIRRANIRPQYLSGDEVSAMAEGSRRSGFNFYTGE